jgi:hypothetical protein
VPAFEKMQIADYSKFDRPPQYFLLAKALYAFRQRHASALPRPGNDVRSLLYHHFLLFTLSLF